MLPTIAYLAYLAYLAYPFMERGCVRVLLTLGTASFSLYSSGWLSHYHLFTIDDIDALGQLATRLLVGSQPHTRNIAKGNGW